MKTSDKKLTLTIGIPTCYGGESLLATAKSIYASIDAYPDSFIICADRNPIAPELQKELEDMGIQVIWNTVEGSQSKKIKQILEYVHTDLFVCTQDDVIFDPYALREIVRSFQEDSAITMSSVRLLPLPPVTFFERAMASMLRITNRIGRYWNKGDNYLLASGRCLIFRTDFFKGGRMFEEVVNGDMFFYLENKAMGGQFAYQHSACVYIRCPQYLRDQVRPSSRYQYSQDELGHYFTHDISSEYSILYTALIVGFVGEIITHPISTLTYIAVFCYTRLRKQSKSIVSNPIWEIDSSTKVDQSK